MSEGEFHAPSAVGAYGGMGTGLFRNIARSKLGIYRGVGKNKILSHVMAANPEILATSEFSPLTDTKTWNRRRVAHDRGYELQDNTWSLKPDSPLGEQFWKSVGLDGALLAFQKWIAEPFINPQLPPGWNL
jgi:hypothetical protein